MVSYREKEMLMAMKFMADHTSQFADEVTSIQKEITEGNLDLHTLNHLPEVTEYSDILKVARESGYDLDVRLEDLLSEEELKELEARYDDIEKEFADKTKLNKTDIVFLLVAVVLQLLRQVFQPSLEFDAFKAGEDRKGNKETAKDAKEKVDKDKVEKEKQQAEGDETKDSRYYHASLDEIVNFNYTSYDLTESGKFTYLKLGGSNHRYKTLGHDPWLGYFFGTLNILTDTVTLGKENAFKSFHVGRSNIGHIIPIANADMKKIVQHGITRWEESKTTIGLAVAHQTYHINSDKLSHDGIPLPFLELFFDSKVIKDLVNDGFDYAHLEFLGTVAKQTVLAEMINYVISVAHRLTIVYQERLSEAKESRITLEDFKESLFRQKTLDEVRTRKIILYSLGMSTIANALIVGGAEIVAAYTGNEKLAEEALKKIDIGGYISTLIHLFTDVRFITKVKKDFCSKLVEEDFQRELRELGFD